MIAGALAMDTERPSRIDLLGEMADAPSSVAAAYGSLIRNWGYTNLKVPVLMDALEELEVAGLVRASQMRPDGSWRAPTSEDRRNDRAAYEEWLPTTDWRDPREFSLDEVGLWYELTDAGRAEWDNRPDQDEREYWTWDESDAGQTLTIYAETEALSWEILRRWAALNPSRKPVSGTERWEVVDSFKMRDGTVVRPGFKLLVRYQVASDN